MPAIACYNLVSELTSDLQLLKSSCVWGDDVMTSCYHSVFEIPGVSLFLFLFSRFQWVSKIMVAFWFGHSEQALSARFWCAFKLYNLWSVGSGLN